MISLIEEILQEIDRRIAKGKLYLTGMVDMPEITIFINEELENLKEWINTRFFRNTF